MKNYLSILSTAVSVVLLVAAPASAGLTTDGLKTYVKRVGARVDEAKGNLLVTSMPVGKGRVQIRLLNDATKNRLGFYAYGFGNVRGAKDAAALYEYLLRSNSDLAIGSFFVDEDQDIGYKFFLSTRDPISYATFETAYLAMAAVIGERGPRIIRLASGAEKPAAEAAGEPAGEDQSGRPAEGAPASEEAPADQPPVEQPPADEPPPPAITNDTLEAAPQPATPPPARPRRSKKP